MRAALNRRRQRQTLLLPPAALTINGQTKYPAVRYVGGHRNGCTLQEWRPKGYGAATLAITGTGNAPATRAHSTLFSSGQHYAGSSIALELAANTDLYFEAIIDHKTASTPLAIMDLIAAAGGFRFLSTANGVEAWLIDGTSNTKTATTGPLPDGLCLITVIYSRATNGFVIYHNGIAKTPIDMTGFGTLAYTGPISVGAAVPQIWLYNSAVALLSLYVADNWIDNHLQDAFVAARCARLKLSQFEV